MHRRLILRVVGYRSPPEEVPEKFEDSKDTEVEETASALPESVLEEIKTSPPELHHVETVDTTDPVKEDSTGDVVKAEVPEVFSEELKADHDIVPPAATEETTVETVAKEVGAEDGETEPATREFPVEVIHEDVDTKPPSKLSSLGDKISQKFHSIVG